jgi:hypothetical protein
VHRCGDRLPCFHNLPRRRMNLARRDVAWPGLLNHDPRWRDYSWLLDNHHWRRRDHPWLLHNNDWGRRDHSGLLHDNHWRWCDDFRLHDNHWRRNYRSRRLNHDYWGRDDWFRCVDHDRRRDMPRSWSNDHWRARHRRMMNDRAMVMAGNNDTPRSQREHRGGLHEYQTFFHKSLGPLQHRQCRNRAFRRAPFLPIDLALERLSSYAARFDRRR